MNNSGPVLSSAGAYFITDDPPPWINPLTVGLTGEAPSLIRATDPISAAIDGVKAWQGAATTTAPAMSSGSPWYANAGVVLLAVILIAVATYVLVKPNG